MAQQTSSAPSLYPPIESAIGPLEDGAKYEEILKIERELVEKLGKIDDPLADVGDLSILPSELLATDTKKSATLKVDPLKRLRNIPNEEAEEEDEEEDEEEEDEEQQVEDEEVGAGDYNETHFDPGEGFEDNDEDGDDPSI